MSELLTHREGRLVILTLNRIDKRNALSSALCENLVAQFEAANDDPKIGAILLEAGGPVFCAGMDLDETLAGDAAARTAIHEKLFTAGVWLRKPLVAAVQGPALGGGVGLVANAHIVVAAQGSSFALTEIRMALWPFVIWRSVVAAIGERRALALSLSSRVFSVQEALGWGLVHEIAPPIELEDRAVDTASKLAAASPEAIRRAMDFVARARALDHQAAGSLAAEVRAQAFASADYREGVKAFQEKRPPKWPSLE